MNKLLIEPIAHERKQLYAFILAGLIYLFFLVILLVDLQRHTSTENIMPQTIPFQPVHAQREKGPAPVRFAQLTSKATPAQPAPQPIVQNSVAQPLDAPPKNTEPSAPSPQLKELEEKKPLPAVEQRKPEQKKRLDPATQQASAAKERSRNKWFKSSSIPSAQEQLQQNNMRQQMNQQQFASNLTAGFNNFVTHKKKIEAEYSINRVHGNQAESLEYEMFAGKLVHSVCAASHNDPLNPRTPLIKEHDVILKITCNRRRQVEDITFVLPSYDEQINSYLVQLIKNVIPPQFPSTHKADKISFPMKIHMARQYYGRGLHMTPA